MCKFVQDFADQVVRRISVSDVLSGSAKMPFTNRQSWLESQRDCPDLRKVFSFLSIGARPRKKENRLRDVKTYLQKVVIAADGLLVVREVLPFQLECERIVVPKKFVQGLLTAIHLRFSHPTANQLKQLARRYFYAINLDKCVETVSNACDTCNSLKFVPEALGVQSTSAAPSAVGTSFAFDVLKRERQLIAILRETVTSFSVTTFMNSETHADHRDALLTLSAEVKGFSAEVRVDPAPGLTCLRDDPILKENGIALDVGREKNPNKNPVAERAVQELEQELLKLQPEKGPVSQVTLSLATAAMNSRIRREGLSSRELWTQRDQFTGQQFPIDDQAIISHQSSARLRNHLPSAISKHHSSRYKAQTGIHVGGLVYLISERSKLQARDKYLVTSISKDSCTLRKFTRQQFRKKEYVVPLNAVYPIVGSPIAPEVVSGDSSSDSEEEVDQVVAVDTDVDDVTEAVPVVAAEPEVVIPGPVSGRPCRPRRPPVWHDDYEMD